jgi:6-pyruvoyltetrahydropterin/6-carboxytetrahydropterin synthase
MKHIIDKSFSFCYGHRVHNQRLDTNFTESGDACLACRHLHGHEGLIKVFLEEDTNSTNVKDTGMVTDFKHLGWFKNFLDDTLDHKFIMDIKDPLINFEVNELTDNNGQFSLSNCIQMPEGYYIPDLTLIRNMLDSLEDETTEAQKSAIFEKYEGMIFVDFVPTSENLSGWLLSVVQ